MLYNYCAVGGHASDMLINSLQSITTKSRTREFMRREWH